MYMAIKVRKSENKKNEALRLYLLGLTSHEIGVLVGTSNRTVQGYAAAGNWKQLKLQKREREEKRIIKRFLKQQNLDSK